MFVDFLVTEKALTDDEILGHANISDFDPITMRTAECIKGKGRHGFWSYNLSLPRSCWSKIFILTFIMSYIIVTGVNCTDDSFPSWVNRPDIWNDWNNKTKEYQHQIR